MRILYIASMDDKCCNSLEELHAHEEELGGAGGHVEQVEGTNRYRCPDFDPTWRTFANYTHAKSYYDHIAR